MHDNLVTKPEKAKVEAFTFDEAVSVIDRDTIFDYMQCMQLGKYYEPPVSFKMLAKIYRAAVHHGSAIQVKRNILVSALKPNDFLSRQEFAKMVLDYLVFGNCYAERIKSRSGKLLSIQSPLAKYVKRGIEDLDQYYFAPHAFKDPHKFVKGDLFHLMEPDVNQEIYGVPEYLASIGSSLLNESATLFRRRYYLNGSHAGFILYMTDAAADTNDIDAIRQALKDSKGPGNFKNLFMYSPNGKKDGMQLIPVSEVAAKDEFINIKNVTRDDQLAAHRMPAQLMGIIPQNTSGFGNPKDAALVFNRNELIPLQTRFEEINEWAGQKVVEFDSYNIETAIAEPARPS